MVSGKSTVAVKLALQRKKPLLLSVSLSLTPYSWKEKLLKTPPGGDVPFWIVGSIILIENAAPSRLSIEQGLDGTVPTLCSFPTALPSSRYSLHDAIWPDCEYPFWYREISGSYSSAGVRLNIVHLAQVVRVAHGVGSFWYP